jgi:hypothetical protein
MSNPSSSASQAQLPSAAEDFAPRRVTSIKSANFIVVKFFCKFCEEKINDDSHTTSKTAQAILLDTNTSQAERYFAQN